MRGTNTDTEFSKVFRTPVKPVEPVKTIAEDVVASKNVEEGKSKPTAKKAIQASPSPTQQKKSSPAKQETKSPVVKISPLKNVVSPVALKKTPSNKLKSPKITRSARKTPKLAKSAAPKTPELCAPVQEKASPKATKSARKSVKKNVQTPTDMDAKMGVSSKKPHVISTPSKTVEQITNKSFYGTPLETITRNEDLIVFSAKPVSAVKPRQRKITMNTPTVKSAKSTPKRMPTRKTPAVKRQLAESDDETPLEQKSRKIEKEVQSSRKKVIRKEQNSDNENENPVINESEEEMKKTKLKLSPEEMISVLKSVHEEERQEKRKAEESVDQRPSKIARLTGHDISTPRLKKMAKRASPKKLVEIAERKEILREEWVSEADNSFLDDTVNTDSRSSRCTIL